MSFWDTKKCKKQKLGDKGKLMKSKSTKDGDVEKRYRWAYNKQNDDGTGEDHAWDAVFVNGKLVTENGE